MAKAENEEQPKDFAVNPQSGCSLMPASEPSLSDLHCRQLLHMNCPSHAKGLETLHAG